MPKAEPRASNTSVVQSAVSRLRLLICRWLIPDLASSCFCVHSRRVISAVRLAANTARIAFFVPIPERYGAWRELLCGSICSMSIVRLARSCYNNGHGLT